MRWILRQVWILLVGLLLVVFGPLTAFGQTQPYKESPALNMVDEGTHTALVNLPHCQMCLIKLDSEGRMEMLVFGNKKPSKDALSEVERILGDRRAGFRKGDSFQLAARPESMAQLKNFLELDAVNTIPVRFAVNCVGPCGQRPEPSVQQLPPVPMAPPQIQQPLPLGSKELDYVGFCGTSDELVKQLKKDGVDVRILNDRPVLPKDLGGNPAIVRSEYKNMAILVHVKGQPTLTCDLGPEGDKYFVIPSGSGIWADPVGVTDTQNVAKWPVSTIDYYELPARSGFVFSSKACQIAACNK